MEESDEIKPEHREVELHLPDVSLAGHTLVPVGPQLVCKSCPYEHGYFIPPEYVFRGMDSKGLPILEKLR